MPAPDYTIETARTIEEHALRCQGELLGKAYNLSMLLTDLLLYAHKEGLDFDEALEDARIGAWVSIPRPVKAPAGRHVARQLWPKVEGGRTLEHYVHDRLRSGRRCPFDAPDAEPGNDDLVLPEPGDWAVRAARGIIADFNDRGADMNDAFHPERVAEETRIEIVDVMAAIMRETLRQERAESSEP
ncbi:hypothetical protein [Methylocella sp.]|uniref:hypothetical protein n=1 Tax=Methylocella sp. TaxID=1978226 RepID=UPI003785328E